MLKEETRRTLYKNEKLQIQGLVEAMEETG